MGDEIGIDHDVVTLRVDGKDVLAAEQYDIRINMFTIPAQFSLTLGSTGAVSDLIQATPPNAPFELMIDDIVQFRGRIDGHASRGSGTDGATLTVHGRDRLAPLHDAFIEDEKSLTDVTYVELVQTALNKAMPNEKPQLGFDNNANRQAVSGASKRTSGKNAAARVTQIAGAGGPDQSAGQNTIQCRIGSRWYDGLIKTELDRGGLTIQCLADGTFLLSSPDTSQASSYRLLRKFENPEITDILTHDFVHDTSTRFSKIVVHFRSGGGDQPRTRAFGQADDFEIGKVLEITRPCVIQDHKCKSLVQADYLARRKLAESRRNGWSLTYTVAGHTTIGITGDRMVWAIDTIVDVDDDVLNISDKFYVEGVRFIGAPEKRTELHLMRLEDLLFGDPEQGPVDTVPKS